MDKNLARMRACFAIQAAAKELARVLVSLEDAYLFDNARQVQELLFETVQIRRDLIELPRETGVPAPLEESPDPTKEDVPF